MAAEAPGGGPSRAQWAYTFVSLGALFVLWSALGALLPENLLPGPVPAFRALGQAIRSGLFLRALAATLGHLVAGTVLAVGVGVAVGILMGRVLAVEALLKDVVAVAQTVPGLIIVTLAIITFKMTPAGIVSVGFFFGLPSVVVTVWQGTRNVDPNLIEMARVYGHTELSAMRRVILPAILPDVVTALRVCVGILWHVTLFAEFIMGQQGFGYQISLALASFEVADIFAWGFTVVVLMVAMEYGLLRPLERALLGWKPRAPAG
jgi:NitT/TauT family transport system permease protein